MRSPGPQAWVYAIKTCIAALAALYIALALPLDRPSWAVTTVFIASQLHAGSTVSKSFYRFAGTCLGALATVALVPNLVQTPELLCLALAAWVSGCLYLSLLDRSPKGYMFMLAGYSAAFIGFPAVETPQLIFDLAVSRVEEISLGVLCSSLVHTLVLPQPIRPLIVQKIDDWLTEARLWWGGIAVARTESELGTLRAPVAALSGYPMLLEAMGTHVAFEGGGSQRAEQIVGHLLEQQSLLLPLIASIEARLWIAHKQGFTMPARVRDLMEQLSDCMMPSRQLSDVHATSHRARHVGAQFSALDWEGLFWRSYVTRIEELLEVLGAVGEARNALLDDQPGAPVHGRRPLRPALDLGMAALSALTAFSAILLGCLLWIGTGWQDGASVPMIAAVACSFFAAQDTPIPSMKVFGRYVLVSVIVTLFYTAVLLPMATNFESVALLLTPAFIALGLLMATPSTAFIGMVLATNIATLTALNNQYAGDFIGTFNGAVATLCGIVLTMVVMGVLRARTPSWVGRRIMQAALHDLQSCLSVNIRARYFKQDRHAFVQRMIDRMNRLIPRSAADEVLKGFLIAELRLGANVLDLRHVAATHLMSPDEVSLVDQLLQSIERYLVDKRADLHALPSHTLQSHLDAALSTCGQRSDISPALIEALVNIRLVLFPDAAATLVV